MGNICWLGRAGKGAERRWVTCRGAGSWALGPGPSGCSHLFRLQLATREGPLHWYFRRFSQSLQRLSATLSVVSSD